MYSYDTLKTNTCEECSEEWALRCYKNLVSAFVGVYYATFKDCVWTSAKGDSMNSCMLVRPSLRQ